MLKDLGLHWPVGQDQTFRSEEEGEMVTSRIAWGRLDRTRVFLLSFSLYCTVAHKSCYLDHSCAYLLWYATLRVTPSAGLAERLGDEQAVETLFFNYDLELEVVWENRLKRLFFHGCPASVSALKTLRQCWTKQLCCAPSWQQGLCVEITKQPMQKQEEIPCPRMWLLRYPSPWKFKQIRKEN